MTLKKLFYISCFLFVVGRLSYFTEPYFLNLDETVYMTLAERSDDGFVLYKEAVDRKPPGLIWLYEIIGKLSSFWNINAFHFVFFLYQIFLGFLLIKIAQTKWAGVLFLIYSAAFPRGIIATNAEYWMMAPLLVALGLLLKDFKEKKLYLIFLSSVIAAIACLFKQYAALPYALAYMAWAIVRVARTKKSERQAEITFQLKSAVASAFGISLVFGSICYYFWHHHALDAFLQHNVWSGFKFIGERKLAINKDTSFWRSIIGMLVSWPLLWAAVYGQFKGLKHLSPRSLILLFFFLGCLLTAFLSGRYFTHYFVPGFVALCLFAANWFEDGWEKFSSKQKAGALVGFVLPGIVFALLNFSPESFGIKSSFDRRVQNEIRVAAAEIKNLSQPSDRIAVWGMATQIYLLSQRGAAGRHVFSDFVSGRVAGFKSAESFPFPGAKEEYLEDLEKEKPTLFVDTSPAAINDYGNFPLSRYPEIKAYIDEHYEAVKSPGEIQIYKRKRGQP